jgi:hypothetical protein
MTKQEQAAYAELGKTPEEVQITLAATLMRLVQKQEREIETLRRKLASK